MACHHCDNKKCVRPSHIFIGTQKDNMQDWTRKGKNRLANDRSLWGAGRQFKNDPTAREHMAEVRRKEFADGRRKAIRGKGGRIIGTTFAKP